MSLANRIAATSLRDHWVGVKVPTAYPAELDALFGAKRCAAALAEIQQWQGYAQSELRSLTPLAQALGLSAVRYQDESQRFGLGSFKALGGAYAVMRYLSSHLQVSIDEIRTGQHREAVAGLTVATATDGNHGRSVAWGAEQAGCACKIYIHAHVSPGRQAAMEAFGAEVIRIDGDYDQSVRLCAQEAEANGWQVISDTSYGEYREVPCDVMAGYSVIASEVLSVMQSPPSHVIVQAGVGGLAAAVAARFWMALGQDRPRVIVVESERAACIIASLRAGKSVTVPVIEETVMAGLSCGEPSEVAFEILAQVTDAAVTIADGQVPPMMHAMAQGLVGEEAIESGECGVPGVIALAAICQDPELKQALGLNDQSQVLVIGCEGATDPEVYQALLAAA